MQIEWLDLLQIDGALIAAAFGWWLIYQSRQRWLDLVSSALSGELDGSVVNGRTGTFAWQVRLAPKGSHARWRITWPSVKTPELVVRLEADKDRRWKRLGLTGDLAIGDSRFDERYLVLCSNPANARRVFEADGVRHALDELELLSANGVSRGAAPEAQRERERGGIEWVHFGDGLTIQIDVSRVEEPRFAARLKELLAQGDALAANTGTQVAPPQEPVTRLAGAMADGVNADGHKLLVLLAAMTPLLWAICSVLLAWRPVAFSGRAFFVGSAVLPAIALAVVAASTWRARGKPWVWRRFARGLPVAMALAFVGPGIVSVVDYATATGSRPMQVRVKRVRRFGKVLSYPGALVEESATGDVFRLPIGGPVPPMVDRERRELIVAKGLFGSPVVLSVSAPLP